MPEELADFVSAHTELSVLYRVGGELELLKKLIAAGFPVIVEKGFEGVDFDGWMGHYVLVTAYNDATGQFTTQDSYKGPDQEIAYAELVSYWRAFNFTYLVVYPPDREGVVLGLLGQQADAQASKKHAAQIAARETSTLTGRDLFFAWFNRGASLIALQDYQEAADAFDRSFAIYPAIPEKERPWRMLWYQTGPYQAYYYTGRYEDAIDLATQTLDNMSEPVLEESYYWRAMAREALGDYQGAVEDYRMSLKVHPQYSLPLKEMERIGVGP